MFYATSPQYHTDLYGSLQSKNNPDSSPASVKPFDDQQNNETDMQNCELTFKNLQSLNQPSPSYDTIERQPHPEDNDKQKIKFLESKLRHESKARKNIENELAQLRKQFREFRQYLRKGQAKNNIDLRDLANIQITLPTEEKKEDININQNINSKISDNSSQSIDKSESQSIVDKSTENLNLQTKALRAALEDEIKKNLIEKQKSNEKISKLEAENLEMKSLISNSQTQHIRSSTKIGSPKNLHADENEKVQDENDANFTQEIQQQQNKTVNLSGNGLETPTLGKFSGERKSRIVPLLSLSAMPSPQISPIVAKDSEKVSSISQNLFKIEPRFRSYFGSRNYSVSPFQPNILLESRKFKENMNRSSIIRRAQSIHKDPEIENATNIIKEVKMQITKLSTMSKEVKEIRKNCQFTDKFMKICIAAIVLIAAIFIFLKSSSK